VLGVETGIVSIEWITNFNTSTDFCYTLAHYDGRVHDVTTALHPIVAQEKLHVIHSSGTTIHVAATQHCNGRY